MLTIVRRSVAPRATACAGPASVAGGAQQVVGDGGTQHPGRVGAEVPRRHVRQRAVYQVGEGGFDDGVAAVGDVGVGERLV